MITESRETTQSWPASDNMVRCTDCRKQVRTERSGRTILVCSVDRAKPALVAEMWRRCRDYVARAQK